MTDPRTASPPDSVPSGDSVTLIERLAELARAATPGPWSASTDPGHAPSARVRAGRRWLAQTCPTLGVASDEDFANAAYIAAVDPETILSLIDRLAVLELRESDRQSSESRDDVDEFFSATDWLDSGSASALEVEADRYDEGWDAGRDALLSSAACSVCGDDHDRMDDAACPGCEAITLGEWIDKVGVERSDAAWEAEDARLASATKPEASPSPENQDLGDEQSSSSVGVSDCE